MVEIHEETLRRLRAGFDPERFYIGLYNPQRPPTPKAFALDINVEVDSWRVVVLHSQPLPPSQYYLLP